MHSSAYIELRKASARGTDSVAADLTRHLHARQYLGKTVLVCDNPVAMLSAVRKQWLKLTRVIQRKRAGTLNADKILKYTHTITHMQRMQFTIKSPDAKPNADVYVLSPQQNLLAPPQCWTVYVCSELEAEQAKQLLEYITNDALIVDYTQKKHWADLGLAQKSELEARVQHEWRRAEHCLASYKIDLASFAHSKVQNVEAIDDALDTLLGASHKFLSTANEFHRILELARPLKLSKHLRERYDSFILLAHRVQALSPSPFTQRFLETYNEDDTFFLHDTGTELVWQGESLVEASLRHAQAGRNNLAKALHRYAHAGA